MYKYNLHVINYQVNAVKITKNRKCLHVHVKCRLILYAHNKENIRKISNIET